MVPFLNEKVASNEANEIEIVHSEVSGSRNDNYEVYKSILNGEVDPVERLRRSCER